jgi:hypothetical protein
MSSYGVVGEAALFGQLRQRFEETVSWLAGPQTGGLSHAVLDQRLEVAGRDLLRQLLQDYFDLRAVRERRLPAVVGQDAVRRTHVERGHQRTLSTVFGQVDVTRLGYRAKGSDRRFPADAVLNLPVGLHSHGLRRLGAIEAARGSFEQAAAAIERSCGGGGRQTSGGSPRRGRGSRRRHVLRGAFRCALSGR